MIINNKRIWLGLFIGIVMSFSVYGQNINAEKITVPDSKLTNLYQIDLGVYRSEQPSDADFKALEKYGIREVLNLRNRHSDDDEAAGTKIKLYRLKMKAHSVSEDQLINALRIIKNRKGPIVFHCHHGSDRTRRSMCYVSYCISRSVKAKSYSGNDRRRFRFSSYL